MEQAPSGQRLDRVRFERAWRAVGGTDGTGFRVLAARYAEARRTYHNSEHIAECLAWLDRVREVAERPAELEIAIFFHDAVYEPLASDNEARSADLLRNLALEAGVPADVIERVATMIESTADHTGGTGDVALLNDIDLTILGSSPSRYERYEREVRQEYAAVSEDRYRAGRACVLRGFLERLEIYRTPQLGALLEVHARQNLASALASLQA